MMNIMGFALGIVSLPAAVLFSAFMALASFRGRLNKWILAALVSAATFLPSFDIMAHISHWMMTQ